MKDCAHVPELGGQQLPAAAKARPTIEELREYLDYEPETGVLRWRKRASARVLAGAVAGSLSATGYLYIQFKGTQTAVHRVAFALHHDRWPHPVCDHIDGNKLNNRASNLRECSALNNQHNRRVSRNNSSGVKGVYKMGDRWRANVKCNGRTHSRVFLLLEDAAAYVEQLREQLHGEFARHE
jgi:hypothetical protein